MSFQEFDVTVHTSPGPTCGTFNRLWLSLIGSQGETPPTSLSPDHHLLPGSTSLIQVQADGPVGQLVLVRLRLEAQTGFPDLDWHCSRVQVCRRAGGQESAEDPETQVFLCDRWLRTGDGDVELPCGKLCLLADESEEKRRQHRLRQLQRQQELIREVDLMTRGLKARSLEGLRQRICTLFLQYTKTPAFNPNVAKLLKVPQNPNQLKNDMFLCRGCHRYLRSASFTASASGCLSSMCKHCTRLNNIARPRDDFTLYKNILRRLRDEEQSLNNKATFPFLLQVEDIQYLIEVLWESCSALNGSSDLFNLVFVRWERQRDWSPWNCILLSKEETKAHLELEDVHQTYEKTFIRGVKHKHAMARQHFSQIPVMAKCLNSHLSAPQGN